MKAIQWASSILVLGVAACASVPPPHEREAASQASIRAATEVGAEQVPQASLHLKLAQEELDKGKSQMKDGDNQAASYTLLRAQADAELALALAHENKTRTDAQQIIDRARGLSGPAANQQPQSSMP